MTSKIRQLLLFTLFGALCACGGGGGGGGDSTSTTTPPTTPPVSNQPPTAVFSVNLSEGFTPLSVSFDASASSDIDGTLTSYSWDFGDGSAAASGQLTSHVYLTPGAYTATLRVTDDDGATASSSRMLRATGVTVSGEVQILSSSAVDADVNDRLTTAVSNNTFTTAQRLGNPVLLGGFVNLPGTGPTDANGTPITLGNLFASGDDADVYAISLSGNELILLSIAEADADLDLALYDAQGNFLDASMSLQSTESLVVNTPGDYFIEVFPASAFTNIAGASNYVLSVGQNLGTSSRQDISRVSDPFIGGELLLSSASESAVSAAHGLQTRSRAGKTLLTRISRDWPGTVSARREARAEFARELATRADRGMSRDQRSKYRTLLTLKQLRRDKRVSVAEVNALRFAHRIPDDQFYGLQWHYPAISLPAAWDITTGAPAPGEDEIIVAVVDTGVLLDHPDLRNQLVPGYDFISDPARARDGDGIDPNPNDEGDLAFAGSSSFHGTHVAGTIAAQSDNGEGVAGVAWNARLMPLRALGVDGGSSFDVIQAVRYAAGLPNDSGTLPGQPADIINLSLGSSFFSASEQNLYDQVRSLGIIVVASAGNESSSSASYPSGYQGVLSVSALDINNALAPYSNFGASIDVAAPGGYNITDQNGDGIGDGVISTLADDSNPTSIQFGYAALSGTSMAAPHVAGVAALMKSVHPGLTPEEFTLALLAGELTDDIGPPGRDNSFGNGRINAQKSVLAALGLASGSGSDPGPILGASTSALNFGVLATQQTLEVRNLGTGTLVIDQVASSEPWLTSQPISVDANALGSYAVNVNRTGLDDGSYSGTLTFLPADSAVNSVSIAVVMQVSTANVEANAGLHYIILVNEAGETVGIPGVQAVDAGRYEFSLPDIPPGEYRLFAGSDMDDDAFLCDSGEACGAYRTLDAPETIVVDPAVATEISGLNLVSEFRTVITTPAGATASAATSNGIRVFKPQPTPQPVREPKQR
jgi:serine protease